MKALEIGNLNGIFILIIIIMIGPPILLTLIGFGVKKSNPNAAKVLFILAAVYLLVGLGICGSLMI
ncbi:hypothetical protein B0I03_106106 [Flavobacterium aquaticum]|jgi:hypothetical protein|uniref:Uncharacterized protein n=1 Tax=Flavobacterium aquaticum TaxID=1236486 RepID=A0A327YMS3_9FLAO|nr:MULTISPECIES: hypothetical protein [Flavobacterium]MCK6606787.1 hypothetical protein [Flavobacterium sp.]RAK20995.1 hypothetical protein B0I03_106106 [Flavobacterium aquaticum]